MTSTVIDWNKDLPPEPEEEYQALVRALKRTRGFNLLFVQCSPAEGEQVISRAKADITEKTIEVLRLEKGVYKFYDIIEALPNRDDINILFVKGLEYSLFEYEEEKRELGWESKDIYSYSWRGVPLVLINLNQQRERFRDNFNICFVFIMRPFAIDYLLQRAPDFFDWRSGLFKVSAETDIILGAELEYLGSLSYQERQAELREIKRRLEDNRQMANQRAELLYQQGLLLVSDKRYEDAIVSFDESLKIQDDSYKSWYYKGLSLNNVGRYEDALASFDKALELEKNDHQVWIERGYALLSSEQYKEALASCDEAIKLKPDFPKAWYYRGEILFWLSRFQEAIASCDRAIKFQSDYYQAWDTRSRAMQWSNRPDYKKELISGCEKIIELFQLSKHNDLRLMGNSLSCLGNYEEAIIVYKKALEFEPDNYWIWNGQALALTCLGRYEDAISSYDKALEIKPDNYHIWYNRGLTLQELGRYNEAIISYYKGLRSVRNIGIFLRQVKVDQRNVYRAMIDLLQMILLDLLKKIGFRR